MSWSDTCIRIAAVALAGVALGCAGDGMVAVTGSATWDGRPIDDGAIALRPSDRNLAPQGSRIHGGRFQLRCPPGKYRVEIQASRPKEGASELTPGMTPHEQFIPSRYNDESKLEVEVTAKSPQDFTFDLLPSPAS